jgi:hypothetical protein
MSMSDRLIQAREAAGFERTADAAHAFGWAYPTYAAHENGSRGFARVASKYAQAYHVHLEWLLTGKGPMRGSAPMQAEIVDLWGRLLDDDRKAVLEFARWKAEQRKSSDR